MSGGVTMTARSGAEGRAGDVRVDRQPVERLVMRVDEHQLAAKPAAPQVAQRPPRRPSPAASPRRSARPSAGLNSLSKLRIDIVPAPKPRGNFTASEIAAH